MGYNVGTAAFSVEFMGNSLYLNAKESFKIVYEGVDFDDCNHLEMYKRSWPNGMAAEMSPQIVNLENMKTTRKCLVGGKKLFPASRKSKRRLEKTGIKNWSNIAIETSLTVRSVRSISCSSAGLVATMASSGC